MPANWNQRILRAIFCLGLGCALLAVETGIPTADEIDLLNSINRHRGDRVFGDFRMYGEIHRAFPQLEMAFFGLTGAEPAQPPLVFSPILMAAARTLLARGVTPVTYEPIDHAPVFAASGYQPAVTGLILCGYDQPNPQMAYLTSFAQTVSKITHSTGFIQPIYGGWRLLDATWREAGVALRTTNGRTSLVLVLGAGSATRYLGGQVYADNNRNGISDPGEGKSGVTVTIGGRTITTGPGGAWWMEQATEEPGEALFTLDGTIAKRAFAGGKINQSIDFRLPNPIDVATAKRLLSSAEKAGKGPGDDARKCQVILLSQTRAADLDDDLRTRVDAVTAPVTSDFADTVKKIRSALALDPLDYKNTARVLQKEWGNSLSNWFKEWDVLYTLRQSVRSVLSQPVAEQPTLARPLLTTLIKAQAVAYDPDMRSIYTELIDSLPKLDEHGPAARPKPKGK